MKTDPEITILIFLTAVQLYVDIEADFRGLINNGQERRGVDRRGREPRGKKRREEERRGEERREFKNLRI